MDALQRHFVIGRVTALFRADLRRAANKEQLKLAQLESLHYLGSCNIYSNTPAALAEYLGSTKGTTSQTLSALEEKD